MKSDDFVRPTAKKQIPLKNVVESLFDGKADNTDLFLDSGISGKQFKLFTDTLPVGLVIYQVLFDERKNPVDFIILESNATYAHTLQVERDQFIGKKITEVYPEITSEPVDWISTFGRVVSSGVPEFFETSCSSNNHLYRVFVCHLKKHYCLASFLDITKEKALLAQQVAEQRKADWEFRENAENYRYLVQHAPTGIYEIDWNGPKFRSVNASMCQILGYTEQELLALNPFDLLYPQSKKRLQQRLKRGFEGKKIADAVEYHVRTKEGRGIWCLLNVRFTYKDGKVDGALVVAHDITARKKAEQQLLVAEKRYRRLYETTQDGIMARDLKGRMVDCNPAYAKMLGYTKTELKRLTVQELLPPEWHGQRQKIVNKVLQTGRSIVFEREYKRKDNSVFPASVRTWRLTDGRGKAIGIWPIVRDITEQKKMQKNLEDHAGTLKRLIDERTKQLKDSERLAAIGQTAGMVGHDLRNPLQTITGELYLAKGEVDSLAEGEAKSNLQESIHVIQEQANYMDKIVSDLQAFVQPIKVDRTPIDIGKLLASVLSAIDIPANISVEINAEEHFPQVKADANLLKRVLINLATNAVQAMPDGGKLCITTEVNRLGHVAVVVRDTGAGIPEAVKKQLFTPLFTTKPRGQGFGLAVCKRVMEAHGGSISFKSVAGQGAEFTIQFPTG